jgi:arabinofuranan 3-O-arabinosyltransferase
VRLSLTPAAAGQGAGVPLATTDQQIPVRVDSWGPTLRRLHLETYPNQRVLTLRENQNPGWQATLGGRTLRPLVLDGWQQGWLVPAGSGGAVELRFAPDTTYATAITGGGLLLAGVVVAAVLPVRRAALLPPAPRRRRRLLTAVIGGLALLAVGGVAAGGLALLGLAVVVTLRALQPHLSSGDRHRLRQVVRWAGFLVPVVLFALGGWLAVRTTGHTAALPQLAALAAATCLWLSVLLGRGARGQRWLSRWKGRSTT